MRIVNSADEMVGRAGATAVLLATLAAAERERCDGVRIPDPVIVLLYGAPGTGKSTAVKFAASAWSSNQAYVNHAYAYNLPLDLIRKWRDDCSQHATPPYRISIVIDDIDRGDKNVKEELCSLIDTCKSRGTGCVFATASIEEIDKEDPLWSRFVRIKIPKLSSEDVAKMLKTANEAATEGSVRLTEEEIDAIAVKSKGNAHLAVTAMDALLIGVEE